MAPEGSADLQRLAEASVLAARDLGRGWRPVPMVNNQARLQPFGRGEVCELVEAARQARGPGGLHEGRAYRHRSSDSLCVVRVEAYSEDGAELALAHRTSWREHGEAVLDTTWRQRWAERDRAPAWIEARWVDQVTTDERIDWLRVEDHTPAVGGTPAGAPGVVTVYEHLTVWSPHRQVTLVLRHALGLDLDACAVRAAERVLARLAQP